MASKGRAVFQTGSLATTATTADQVILSYPVSNNSRFYLLDLELNCRLTTFAATNTNFGVASLRVGGIKLATFMMAGPGCLYSPVGLTIPEGLIVVDNTQEGPGQTIDVVCTPSATTGFTWEANIAGYEV